MALFCLERDNISDNSFAHAPGRAEPVLSAVTSAAHEERSRCRQVQRQELAREQRSHRPHRDGPLQDRPVYHGMAEEYHRALLRHGGEQFGCVLDWYMARTEQYEGASFNSLRCDEQRAARSQLQL